MTTSFVSRSLRCTCGRDFDAKMYIRINLDKNPELRSLLERGEINAHKCPACGRTILGMTPVILKPAELSERRVSEATVKYEW